VPVSSTPVSRKASLLGAAAAAGAGAFAYGLLEPLRPRLVRHEVPVRWSGPPLEVLHLSDTHLSPRDGRLQAFLRDLPRRLGSPPDLVITTGDMIEGEAGIEPLVESLDGIRSRLGRFYVLGSHDYFVSSGPSYTKYFSKDRSVRRATPIDSARFEAALSSAGWVSLTNRTEVLAEGTLSIRLTGVDDPYLRRHRTDHIGRAGSDDLVIGVMHAPDIVSEWVLQGTDLVLAGHTHGGQVRLPLLGAAVTNSTLPTALAGGLHRIGSGWLHVSPGLGTGRYSPIRFLTPPEATLLRLVPERRDGEEDG
jgi:uncharacterized protein